MKIKFKSDFYHKNYLFQLNASIMDKKNPILILRWDFGQKRCLQKYFLTRYAYASFFSDNSYFNLTRIGHFFFYFLRDGE